MRGGNYAEAYASVTEEEKRVRDLLIQFEQDDPNVAKESNVNDILSLLKERKQAAQEAETKKKPREKDS